MAVGKRYRAEHIRPGLVGYPENEQLGTLLVTQEAIDKMRPTFIGKPVVNVDHTDASPEDLFDFTTGQLEEVAVGVVAEVGKLENGWDYVDVVIWDEDTQKNIENGFSVSNAYLPTEEGPGGVENQIPYDNELKDGEYLHLAIVPNPRYQNAKIYANSVQLERNPQEDKSMGIKLFRKKEAPKPVVKNATEEMEEMDVTNAVYKNEDGSEVSLEEMVNAYKAQKNQSKNSVLNEDDEIDVDGEKVKVSELLNAYKAGKTAENAEPPQDVVAEEVVDETKQGPGMVSNSAKKTDSVNKAIKNAAGSEGITPVKILTKQDRLAMGKARYGSLVDQGGSK